MKPHYLAVAILLIGIGARVYGASGVVTSPTGIAPDRYVYYPGTEALDEDEIRVVACGTGMPASRRGQAASCWLIETGNDKTKRKPRVLPSAPPLESLKAAPP